MAKTAVSSFSLPTLTSPKIDIDGVFGLLKTNLSVAHEAQSILVETAQSVAKAQYDYFTQTFAGAKTAFDSKDATSPAGVFADAKTATEKLVAVTKEIVDLTVSAQRRVTELVVSRGQANIKALQQPVA